MRGRGAGRLQMVEKGAGAAADIAEAAQRPAAPGQIAHHGKAQGAVGGVRPARALGGVAVPGEAGVVIVQEFGRAGGHGAAPAIGGARPVSCQTSRQSAAGSAVARACSIAACGPP
jgi:hypothetical protein